MRSPESRDVESLLRHAGWMKSLARRLVADPSVAEDLVQDTWVAALQHPRSGSGSPKGWLAAVLRNFARQSRRRAEHRTQREERSARSEATPSAHDAVASAELQRSLVEAVLALEASYRDVIVWRFFEGVPPKEIASRLSVPVDTVKTRLARGIEKLRAELDRRSGGKREAWLSALIPFAVRPEIPASALWTILVNTNLKLGLAAALVIAALVGIWNLARSRPAASLSAVPAASTAEPSLSDGTASEKTGVGAFGRAEIATKELAKSPTSPAAADSAPMAAQGHVIDTEGMPVSGVDLVSGSRTDTTTLATSASDGSFSIPSAQLQGCLFAKDAAFTTVFGVDAWRNAPMASLVVVVAPRIQLAGTVVDDAGRPIAGADVHVRVEKDFLQELGLVTDQSFEARTATTTDDAGRFELQDAPGMPDAKVDVVAAGFVTVCVPAPRESTDAMRFVLALGKNPVIRGEVVDAQERPVPGAWLAAGGKTTRADDGGRFVLEPGEDLQFDRGGWWLGLVAVKPDYLPARIPKPDSGWPAEIVVHLDGPPLSIRGHVVDSEDHPVAGAEVWALDETRFGPLPRTDSYQETQPTLEFLVRGSSLTKSDDQGAFELGGLLPRGYRIVASHKSTLRAAVTPSIQPGGDEVTIAVPGLDHCAQVAGRVVSGSGTPIPGVLVFPLHVFAHEDGKQSPSPPAAYGDGKLTDVDGRFAFDSLCTEELQFQVSGGNLDFDWNHDPPAKAKLDDLEIVVALRCHLQVDLGDHPDLADEFNVLDASGKELDVVRWQGPQASVGTWGKIHDGRSDILAVADTGRTLVLKKNGDEVQRIDVRLALGEITVVRP
jgi:RNA polymerase sigma-70 factor (ECF subfamily)